MRRRFQAASYVNAMPLTSMLCLLRQRYASYVNAMPLTSTLCR